MKVTVPYLHIALHGKRDKVAGDPRDCDIEVGTVEGESCDSNISQWFKDKLRDYLVQEAILINNRPVNIKTNVRLRGDASKVMGRKSFGKNYQTIQFVRSRGFEFGF